MILGIDVGGTHTDSVLMQNGKILRKSKVMTDKSDLLKSVTLATHAVAQPEDIKQLRRIVLSTTMTTNAVAQHQLDPVGLIVMSGPGVAHRDLPLSDRAAFVKGYMNHRGLEAESVDEDEIVELKTRFAEQGVKHFGVIGKFSTRSPAHEQTVRALLDDQASHVTLGHQLSGELSFPRRISTAYLNEAVWRLHSTMADQLQTYLQQLGVDVPLYILKADGGTIDVEQSRHYPVQTILSGPAATIMGVLPYAPTDRDSLSIDVGGTTTDIALFADGAPLLEPKGVQIEEHKTLIRGLLTHSIAIGGDSHVQVIDGKLVIGPERKGSAMAFDGPVPTPTDAMIVLGLADIGDKAKATAAIDSIAAQLGQSTPQAAQAIMDLACETIAAKVRSMIAEVNSKPVYTIHEMLEGKVLAPTDAIVVGGPAPYMAKQVGELLKMTPVVPGDSDVINASGAAMARTTVELTLMADTEERQMSIAEEGVQADIPRNFTLADLIAVGREKLEQIARVAGAPEEDIEIEVADSQSFNVIRDGSTTGKNFRVRLQIKPGLTKHAIQ
ncbi:hydantoinase/oxoprolinase [Oxalicibacterium flavum]|uniref:Hydantoinase/oxoprolinase n=1 Tax=Oxalicibacterium flavum TaxID=179467 RepID=A0A8J2XUX8_9BURK|nr:hydantoinase/oxoprolinase family protein [Oxalicibacterium flavum]GGC03918.1 hydantoinase/oxoprolinase [Oxalicibacterium flavum]